MKRTCVVDADSIPYAVGFMSEGDPVEYAYQSAKKRLMAIEEETESELVVYIGGEGNFREEIAVTKGYKSQRLKDKPTHHAAIRQYMQDHWGATKIDGMEVDDKVSILLWEDFKANGGDREACTLILSSGDKDLNNTPGWHHNPRTGVVSWITELQAMRHFWFQMLMGDSVDNITGVPDLPASFLSSLSIRRAPKGGCGKATAKKLMASTSSDGDAERLVWECYMQWGYSYDIAPEDVMNYFLEQAQLLWMVREMKAGLPVMYKLNEDAYYESRERVYGRDYGDVSSGGSDPITVRPVRGGVKS